MSPQRIDYYDSPEAPRANSLVPSVNVVVVNHAGEILLIRRTDNGNWAVPGGAIDLGESVAQAAVRETLEESGIDCAITGIVGIYSDPKHVILYTSNDEVRQEFSIVLTARPLAGQPTPSSESSEVRWVPVSQILEYTMDRSMRIRINDYLTHRGSPVGEVTTSHQAQQNRASLPPSRGHKLEPNQAKERASPPGECWKLRSIRLHQARRPSMRESYDGRQVVGMDLHRRRSVLVRMTGDGRKLETARIDNSPAALRTVLAREGSSPRVVVEATYGWYWAADTLAAAGAEVHLAHPLGVKAFAYRRVKNDGRDCADLADLLRLGPLAEAWIARSGVVSCWRSRLS